MHRSQDTVPFMAMNLLQPSGSLARLKDALCPCSGALWKSKVEALQAETQALKQELANMGSKPAAATVACQAGSSAEGQDAYLAYCQTAFEEAAEVGLRCPDQSCKRTPVLLPAVRLPGNACPGCDCSCVLTDCRAALAGAQHLQHAQLAASSLSFAKPCFQAFPIHCRQVIYRSCAQRLSGSMSSTASAQMW